MKEGEFVITSVPQSDGRVKRRPALVLRTLPPFGDLLLCGVSTKLRQQVVGFDEILSPSDEDFAASGLTTTSLIRLGFLSAVPRGRVAGAIGSVSAERHERLLRRLSEYLVEDIAP